MPRWVIGHLMKTTLHNQRPYTWVSWSGHNNRAAARSAHARKLKGQRSALSFLFSCPTVASSSAEHDLHSNWLLRVPRVAGGPGKDPHCAKGGAQKHPSGSTSSRLRLQRNPIHLPKAVHSAFQSLRSRPKLKKWDALLTISHNGPVMSENHIRLFFLSIHFFQPNICSFFSIKTQSLLFFQLTSKMTLSEHSPDFAFSLLASEITLLLDTSLSHDPLRCFKNDIKKKNP